MYETVEPIVNDIFLPKDLIVDVCEPYIEVEKVLIHGSFFNLCRFGSFELGDTEYIFGTEEEHYNSVFDNASVQKLPIVFAEKGKKNDTIFYTMVAKGYFRPEILENIEDIINYTLESQRVMAKYQTRCCEAS